MGTFANLKPNAFKFFKINLKDMTIPVLWNFEFMF